MLLTELALGLA